ncbi:hypothetical protein ABZ841_29710, partial [Streptomyces flaveolus]
MLPADMVGGVSAARAANLEVTGEALSTFVKRVDGVLTNLEGSPGNPTRVGVWRRSPQGGRAGPWRPAGRWRRRRERPRP